MPRYGNPTLTALEAAVAALEGGEASLSYASGMATIHGALLGAGARAGTAVVAAQDVYGATYALLNRVLASQGVTVRFVDGTDLAAVAAAVAELKPVAVVAETISNPLLKLADVPRLAEISHGVGAALIVDNTFASPYLFRPLQHGADYSVHSATKYLGGHGDVLGGVVVTSSGAADRAERDQQAGGRQPGAAGGVAGAARASRRCRSACSASATTPRRSPAGWSTIRA